MANGKLLSCNRPFIVASFSTQRAEEFFYSSVSRCSTRMSEQDLNVTDATGLALYPKSRLFDCFLGVFFLLLVFGGGCVFAVRLICVCGLCNGAARGSRMNFNTNRQYSCIVSCRVTMYHVVSSRLLSCRITCCFVSLWVLLLIRILT